MKSDSVTMGLLFDRYGELLTEKQRTCFELYHGQDYSLAEIAQETGVSRQGVHDSLARAEAALRRFEDCLGCAARDAHVRAACLDIEAAAERLLARCADPAVRALAEEILRRAESIKE